MLVTSILQTDCQAWKYWQTDLGSYPSEKIQYDSESSQNYVAYWIPAFNWKLNMRWTKDPMHCQFAEILKVYLILTYKILRVGTYLIHFVVLIVYNLIFIYK